MGSGRGLLAVLASGVIVLTGCGNATPTTSETPAPTESAVVREVPQPRLPLTCDDLVAPSAVAAFAGTPVPLASDADAPPRTWLDVVERQFGALSCRWELDRDMVTLSFLIAPESGDFYLGGGVGIAPGYYERYDVVGDRSVHSCPYGSCSFEIVVDGHLVTGYAHRPDVMDEAVLEPLILPVLEGIASAIAGVPELGPRWTVPAGALPTPGFGCEEGVPIAELAALNGVTRPYATGTDWESGSFTAMLQAVEPTWCTIASEDGSASFSLAVVAGGAWAFELWEAEPPAQWDGGFYRALSVEGVGGVLLGDEGVAPSSYDALFEVEGSLVSFAKTAQSEQDFLALLPDLAEILAAAR